MSVFSRTVTVKLDRQHAEKLDRLAKKRAISKSEVLRDALDATAEDAAPAGLESVAHLVGAFEGPADLSTNPKHLEGPGRDHRRHRSSRRPS